MFENWNIFFNFFVFKLLFSYPVIKICKHFLVYQDFFSIAEGILNNHLSILYVDLVVQFFHLVHLIK